MEFDSDGVYKDIIKGPEMINHTLDGRARYTCKVCEGKGLDNVMQFSRDLNRFFCPVCQTTLDIDKSFMVPGGEDILRPKNFNMGEEEDSDIVVSVRALKSAIHKLKGTSLKVLMKHPMYTTTPHHTKTIKNMTEDQVRNYSFLNDWEEEESHSY